MGMGIYQKLKPYIFISLAGLFLLFVMGLQVSLAVIIPELMADLKITAAGIGIIGSSYFYAYTCMQIPVGILLDCCSSKKVIGASIIVCVLGTILFAISESILLAFLGRMLIGFGSALAFIAVLYIGAQWFHRRYFALISGLAMVMAALGAVSGSVPLVYMVRAMGWRYSLLMLSIVGIILAIFIFVLLEDKYKKEKCCTSQLSTIFKELIIILRKRQTWAFIVFAFAIWSPITGFASLWGVPFLKQAYSMSTTRAAFCCSIIWIGIAVGSPLFAWLSERFKSRTLPLRCGALLGVICSVIVIYFHAEMYVLHLMLFGFGVAAGGQALIFAVINDVTDEALIGSSFGILDTAVVGSGFIFQPFIGMLLHHRHPVTNTVITLEYSTSEYMSALAVIPLIFIVSFIVSMFFIKETHGKQTEKDSTPDLSVLGEVTASELDSPN
jgi:MFS family permease